MVRGRRDEAYPRCGVPSLGNAPLDLLPRQLAALSGLSSLGHLDLQLQAVGQILHSHPEPA